MKISKYLLGFLLFSSALWGIKLENHLVDTEEAIYRVPTSRKVVALTFDDGPLATTTPAILAILKEKNVKATFFVVGEMAERFPWLLRQEIDEGHEIGNHTFTHPKLSQMKKQVIEDELKKTENLIAQTGYKPFFFRPPGGSYNANVLHLAREKGYTLILWSIDTYDWRSPPVENVVTAVLKRIKPGSIILLHDGKYPSPTPEALPYIIDDLRARGYEFVTISELLQYYEEP